MSSLTQAADPEMEFLASEKRTGDEWELFKENVRPLKRGRNVDLLNCALKSQSNPLLNKSLLDRRRRMIDAIDDYDGEDPLRPWLECIKWVQESFPASGEYSGLVVIYEQCVRTFWHDERYKNDLRYLKVWLEYAGNCSDAEVIYRFLEANEIGQSHAIFYISYASHLETKNKMNKADEIFSLGIHRKVQPLDKLEDKYRKFIVRLTRRNKAAEEAADDDQSSVRSFGTLLSTGEFRLPLSGQGDVGAKQKSKIQRPGRPTPLAIYNDNIPGSRNQSENLLKDSRQWSTLGTQQDRNKENTSIPSKWTSFKVPQKPSCRTAPTSSCIEVFIDEDCAEKPARTGIEHEKPSVLKLRRANSQSLKKDSELLKDNPLKNFPRSSLPR